MTETISTVAVTIDGHQIAAQPGELVIAAAERHGIYIPHFCYHKRMSPVGMCRMCLVEIDTGRGPQLQPSCMVPVSPDMTVDTQSEATQKLQQGVLEHLLINHPLDCPVCDKGGECSLQDQTLAYGPGESRFVEEKRHFQKPIPVSQLVDLDRERCILCDRCTRFADEVAGDPLITFTERGNNTQVLTFPDQPFSSYFSGNTVELCPVGALTASPYRFKARPWDLQEASSTCTTCAVGCGMTIQSSRDQLVRFLGVDVDAVNHGWLCDKGRFVFEANNSEQRITAPQIRTGAEQSPTPAGAAPTSPTPAGTETVGWNTALAKVAEAVSAARPGAVAVIGGAHGTNEDAFAWAKLTQTAFGGAHLDAQLNDGLPQSLLAQLPAATIDEACQADTVILLGPDLKEELPVLYLRLRSAATAGDTKLVEVGPVATGLRPYADTVVECLGGESAVAAASLVDPSVANSANPYLLPLDENTAGNSTAGNNTAGNNTTGSEQRGEQRGEQRAALAQRLAEQSVVVVIGRGSLAESDEAIVEAAQLLAQRLPHAKFLPVLRRSNVRGALAMGITPNPSALDSAGILTAAKNGEIDVLFLLGADPISDFFDSQLAQAGIAGAGLVVAVDAFDNASVQHADVVLPAALFGEKDGTTTNIEGRVRSLSQLVNAPGSARADWVIAAELARHCGYDLGFATRSEITDEIARTVPAYRECGTSAAAQLAGEGVLTTAAETAVGGTGNAAATGIKNPTAPPRDGYSLRLVTTRSLYDAGVAVSQSPSIARLAPGPALLVNPTDFALIGVEPGAPVSLVPEVVLPAYPSEAVSRGNAVVRLNQPATAAQPASQPGQLFAATDQFVDIRVTPAPPASTQ